jgi:hypothetical protein
MAAVADQSYYPLLDWQRRDVAWPVIFTGRRCRDISRISDKVFARSYHCHSVIASLSFTMTVAAHARSGASLRSARMDRMSECRGVLDVQERLRLHAPCQSFDWFLVSPSPCRQKNRGEMIAPGKPDPEVFGLPGPGKDCEEIWFSSQTVDITVRVGSVCESFCCPSYNKQKQRHKYNNQVKQIVALVSVPIASKYS